MIVYLLRAVLADLHEEGVELGDDEGDPDAHGEVDQREYHEEDVEPDVPVAMSSAMVDAPVPADNWAVGQSLGSFAFGSLRPPDSPSVNCGSTTRVKQHDDHAPIYSRFAGLCLEQ